MIRTLVRLSPADLAMLVRALLLVVATRVALWVLPYRWVQRALNPERALSEKDDAHVETRYGRRVVWAVDAVARRVLPKKPCLTQALVARWLLAKGGLATDLRIGVAFGDKKDLMAHAWLEQEGRVIMGGATSARYTPLTPLREAANPRGAAA